MSQKVKYAVIPVAGHGTRFLPVTKSVPKELLPIIDRPIILYIVEEAVKSGVETIVFVTGRGKYAIEDFFDTAFELESVLARTGKLDLLDQVKRIKSMCEIVSVRQKEALGLGHAVLCAKPAVGDRPFAVLLGDEVMLTAEKQTPATAKLCQLFEEHKKSTVAVMEVPSDEVGKYGIIAHKPATNRGIFEVTDVVEKPSPEQAPSRLALPGRYVFSAEIFEHLSATKPGRSGEIQLTDAMTTLCRSSGLLATTIDNERFDTGDRLGFLKANIACGLRDPRLKKGLAEYILSLQKELGK